MQAREGIGKTVLHHGVWAALYGCHSTSKSTEPTPLRYVSLKS